MSEIKINYTVTPDEFADFCINAQERKIGFMKKAAIIFGIALIIFDFYTTNIPGLIKSGLFEINAETYILTMIPGIIFGIVLIILGFLYPRLYRKNVIKASKDSALFRYPVEINFFDNHIEEEAGIKGSNYYSKKYLPLEAIKHITETDTSFLFYLSSIEAMIIPKRALSDEDRKKLFHLIHNLFMDKFNRVNSGKQKKR